MSYHWPELVSARLSLGKTELCLCDSPGSPPGFTRAPAPKNREACELWSRRSPAGPPESLREEAARSPCVSLRQGVLSRRRKLPHLYQLCPDTDYYVEDEVESPQEPYIRRESLLRLARWNERTITTASSQSLKTKQVNKTVFNLIPQVPKLLFPEPQSLPQWLPSPPSTFRRLSPSR